MSRFSLDKLKVSLQNNHDSDRLEVINDLHSEIQQNMNIYNKAALASSSKREENLKTFYDTKIHILKQELTTARNVTRPETPQDQIHKQVKSLKRSMSNAESLNTKLVNDSQRFKRQILELKSQLEVQQQENKALIRENMKLKQGMGANSKQNSISDTYRSENQYPIAVTNKKQVFDLKLKNKILKNELAAQKEKNAVFQACLDKCVQNAKENCDDLSKATMDEKDCFVTQVINQQEFVELIKRTAFVKPSSRTPRTLKPLKESNPRKVLSRRFPGCNSMRSLSGTSSIRAISSSRLKRLL